MASLTTYTFFCRFSDDAFDESTYYLANQLSYLKLCSYLIHLSEANCVYRHTESIYVELIISGKIHYSQTQYHQVYVKYMSYDHDIFNGV